MAEERNGGGLLGFGYGEGEDRVSALRDMLDGGGRGQAGPTFEGGPLSGLLNAIGVRPMGYADTMAAGGYGGMGGGDASMSSMAPMASPMPTMRPQMGYMQPRPDGIGATPATAYGRYTPSSTYDEAALYASPMQFDPRVTPAQITPNDFYSALVANMQRFR